MILFGDSTDAREQREAEAAQEELERFEQQHRPARCGGWLGEDEEGRPVPCLRCRPHLALTPCRTCSTGAAACTQDRARHGGPCCDHCDHGTPL